MTRYRLYATFGTKSDTYMNRVWCDIWFIRGALVKAYSSASPSKYTHTEQSSVSMYGEAGRQAEFLHDRDPRPSQLDSYPLNCTCSVHLLYLNDQLSMGLTLDLVPLALRF
jgi:hypothetical protein